ncbi:MAG TPA: prolyl oligopeptidase family serine peptidase [Bryobacteraceae bacterium]|nr:prolyl oligopeptidase family serine peptidase [Bryobacteraceae bacterium]
MPRLVVLLLFAAPILAEPWSIEKLFTRPFAWGTSPAAVTWSKQGHTLLFLWNKEGNRFRDLYAYDPVSRKPIRLTDMEAVRDELNLTEAEKDERRKQYLMPAEGIGAFQMSRDGRRATFAYLGDIYIVPTDGSAPPFRLTKTKAAESAPQLSPDASKIAYERDGQLFVDDLKTGQLWQITDIEEKTQSLGASAWSPDGKSFFYTVRIGSPRQLMLPNYSGRVVTARPFTRSLAGDDAPESRIYVVPSEGGKPVAIEASPWGAKSWGDPPEWSPDSRYLLRRVVNPDLKRQELLVLDASTGKARVVFEQADAAWANSMSFGWSPDSRNLFYTSDRDGWEHLYRVSVDGGNAQQLTHGEWEIHRDSFARAPEWVGDSIYYSSTESGASERQFYRIRADGSDKQRLSERAGINIGAVSADGGYIAVLEADLNNPFDLYVNGARVTTSPRAEFSSYRWPESRFVSFPSRKDHKTVAAKILLPPGYRPENRNQKPWPAVFFIHGSGYATSVLKQWGSYQELRYVFNCYLANKGYVVMDLDYRGSSGYGRDWRTGVYLQMGGPDLEDVLGGVDYLRSLGNIDMRRIGIWGVSYGGFMTNMAMFLSPDTFRAGAGWAAVNDWENYNAFYTEQRLTKPRDNPEAYRRSSPIYFSGLLKHPLLVVHGIVDNNVMFQDAVELTEKLIHEGKDFSEIYYPEESHGFVRDETLIDSFRRTAEWLDRNLQ